MPDPEYTMAPAITMPGLSTVNEMASGPKLPVFHDLVLSTREYREPVDWMLRTGGAVASTSVKQLW